MSLQKIIFLYVYKDNLFHHVQIIAKKSLRIIVTQLRVSIHLNLTIVIQPLVDIGQESLLHSELEIIVIVI